MKRCLMALVTVFLLVAVAQLGLAAEWTMKGGLEVQSGEYEFETSPPDRDDITEFTASIFPVPDSDPWKFSVDVPTLRYTLAATSSDNWVLSGFFSVSGEPVDAEVDENAPVYHEERDTYGRSRAYGADAGRLFDLDSFTLQPKVGYRFTEFVAGTQKPAEGGFYSESMGLRIRGLRVGLEGVTKLGDRVTVKGDIGYSPSLRVDEVYDEVWHHPDGGETERRPDYWEVLDQKSDCLDLSVGLEYQFTDSLSMQVGYKSETGSVTIDDPADSYWRGHLDGWEFSSSLFSIGANLTF